MSKSKPHGKEKKKSAQLVLRVERAERDDFVALCERLDTTAAREIRRFMRDWVASQAQTPATAEDEPEVAAATIEVALEPAEAPAQETAPEVPPFSTEPAKRRKRAGT
ncbi:MAG: hypothetical protein WCS20_08145 [Alphaproteobacteria bacterium]|jgi:hypothetical protein